MKWRRFYSLCVLIVATSLARGQAVQQAGYLVAPTPASASTMVQACPYLPQPGDILLYESLNKFHHFCLRMATTSPPTHTAIVIARADGTPAILDLIGARAVTAKVTIVDVEPRLSTYEGTVMVRRLRTPLTVEQSHALTKFAEAQAGKRFAVGRVVLQATPFCARSGWRRDLFGGTVLDRDRWFCSELVVAAGVVCHLIDGKKCCANSTYPHDLAFDETIDLSPVYHPVMSWQPAAAGSFARPILGPPQER